METAIDSPNTADSATTAASSSLYHQLQSGLNLTSQSQNQEPGKEQLPEAEHQRCGGDLPDPPQRGKQITS